jgi:hypothetical protein
MNAFRKRPRQLELVVAVALVGSFSLSVCLAEDLMSKGVLNTPREIQALAYSPDGKYVAAGGIPSFLILWDLKKGQPKPLTGHTKRVLSLGFTPDGKSLVAGDDAGILKFWEVRTGKDLGFVCKVGAPVYALAISPDGKTVATSAGNGVMLWDAQTGKKGNSFFGPVGTVYALAWAPDGKTVATGGGGNDITLWDGETGKAKSTLKGHDDIVRSLAFHPDGELLVSGGNMKVRVWDVAKEKEKTTLQGHNHKVTSVAVSPDGKWVVSVALDGSAKVWDLETEQAKYNRREIPRASRASPFGTTACRSPPAATTMRSDSGTCRQPRRKSRRQRAGLHRGLLSGTSQLFSLPFPLGWNSFGLRCSGDDLARRVLVCPGHW